MRLKDFYHKHGKFQAKKKLRKMSRLLYMGSSKSKACAVCGFSKYIEIHHIIPICHFPPEALISDIVNLKNLQALCPNCHSLHHNECKIK